MAGIKETKNQLRNDIQELYKRFTAAKPEEIISNPENAKQLNELAGLSSELTKKIEALSYLAAIEETYPEIAIVPPVPEVKAPEIKIPEIVPPVAEVKVPEIPPVAPPVIPPAANIPLVPEIKTPEVVQSPPVPAGKKLPDLKTFIGFNEKLMFIRSLFNGDTTAYDDAIAQVNNSNSFAEAETILKNLSAAYKWAQDAEPVQIFHSSVKRRFA